MVLKEKGQVHLPTFPQALFFFLMSFYRPQATPMVVVTRLLPINRVGLPKWVTLLLMPFWQATALSTTLRPRQPDSLEPFVASPQAHSDYSHPDNLSRPEHCTASNTMTNSRHCVSCPPLVTPCARTVAHSGISII